MARAIWTGELTFGRVRIPVRLEGVVEDKSVRTHLVHRKDKGRLQMRRFCRKCGREIPWDDAARAVEVGNHEVVDFDPEELRELKSERANELVLNGFADPQAVDPVYFDRSYALAPVGKQPRAFELLASAIRDTGKIAVTRANFSGKSYPAIIRSRGAELVLTTLHFGDEVRDARTRAEPQLRPSAREKELASSLIGRMMMPFDPSTTEDPYRLAVEQRAIGRKARPIDEQAARRKAMEQNAEVIDLMTALERSLTEKGARGEQRVQRAARTASRKARPGVRPRPAKRTAAP
jgi:DNA end-binding protein Ku